MNDDAKPKILPLGEGLHELKLLNTIRQSGYQGAIAILDHRSAIDTEVALRENLDGLKKLLKQLGAMETLKSYRD